MVKYKLRYIPEKGRPHYGKQRFTSLTSARNAEKRAKKSGKYKDVWIV